MNPGTETEKDQLFCVVRGVGSSQLYRALTFLRVLSISHKGFGELMTSVPGCVEGRTG